VGSQRADSGDARGGQRAAATRRRSVKEDSASVSTTANRARATVNVARPRRYLSNRRLAEEAAPRKPRRSLASSPRHDDARTDRPELDALANLDHAVQDTKARVSDHVEHERFTALPIRVRDGGTRWPARGRRDPDTRVVDGPEVGPARPLDRARAFAALAPHSAIRAPTGQTRRSGMPVTPRPAPRSRWDARVYGLDSSSPATRRHTLARKSYRSPSTRTLVTASLRSRPCLARCLRTESQRKSFIA